jgi:hypothetical protein
MPEPEALARIDIDRQLEAAGWLVQDRDGLSLFAGPDLTKPARPILLLTSLCHCCW